MFINPEPAPQPNATFARRNASLQHWREISAPGAGVMHAPSGRACQDKMQKSSRLAALVVKNRQSSLVKYDRAWYDTGACSFKGNLAFGSANYSPEVSDFLEYQAAFSKQTPLIVTSYKADKQELPSSAKQEPDSASTAIG